MIVLNSKSKDSLSSSSPLSLGTSDNKKAVSFSDLLRGISEKKEGKAIQNGSLVLALASEEKGVKSTKESSKADKFISLLKSDENIAFQKEEESLELNPKLTNALSKDDIKALVADAKNYLKAKIQDSEGYKKAEIKELPKTINGLIDVAKKFGIDVDKITLQEVKTEVDFKSKSLISDTQNIDLDKSKNTSKKVQKEASTTVAVAQSMNESKQKAQAQLPTNELKQTTVAQLVNEAKSMPIFKAQSGVEHTSTQQIVQAKSNNLSKVETKSQKSKADETLKLLLRDEKQSNSTLSLTADFSVATAKVIAPTATADTVKSLEQLLQGDTSSKEQSSMVTNKTEQLTTHKADSFEVKLNEAKQMIKYLSNDVKNAIEDYKSPFTRVKVQLNPQHLGEVDLTVVQRGKNLHVNISSNNAAINALAMNANELKVQLNNNGINSASLNFSDNSQNGDTNSGREHQQKRNEQRAGEEYNYFESEEANEEILSSLEIVVPRYI